MPKTNLAMLKFTNVAKEHRFQGSRPSNSSFKDGCKEEYTEFNAISHISQSDSDCNDGEESFKASKIPSIKVKIIVNNLRESDIVLDCDYKYNKPNNKPSEITSSNIENKPSGNNKATETAKKITEPNLYSLLRDQAYGKEEEIRINTALEQLIFCSPLDAVRNILPEKNDINGKIFLELGNYYEEITPEIILKQIAVKKHIVAELLFPSSAFGHSHKDAILRFNTLFGDKEQELLKAIDIKQEDVMISYRYSKKDYSKTEDQFRKQIISQLANFINNNNEKGADENYITQITQITQDLDSINKNHFDSLWGKTGNEKLEEAIKSSNLYRKIADTKSDNKFSPEASASTFASSNKSSIVEEKAKEAPLTNINGHSTTKVKFEVIQQKK